MQLLGPPVNRLQQLSHLEECGKITDRLPPCRHVTTVKWVSHPGGYCLAAIIELDHQLSLATMRTLLHHGQHLAEQGVQRVTDLHGLQVAGIM